MIITTFMIGIKNPEGGNYISAALIGNLGAIIGSIISARLMLIKTKSSTAHRKATDVKNRVFVFQWTNASSAAGNIGGRFMEAMLEGGKNGVSMGVSIIPGVLIICTLVMMLTNGPSAGGAFTGAKIRRYWFSAPGRQKNAISSCHLCSVLLLQKAFRFLLQRWALQEPQSD